MSDEIKVSTVFQYLQTGVPCSSAGCPMVRSVRCDLKVTGSGAGLVHQGADPIGGERSTDSCVPTRHLDNHAKGAFEAGGSFPFNSQTGTAWRRHISRIALDPRVSSPITRLPGICHRTEA